MRIGDPLAAGAPVLADPLPAVVADPLAAVVAVVPPLEAVVFDVVDLWEDPQAANSEARATAPVTAAALV
jgi:hypothetical protein